MLTWQDFDVLESVVVVVKDFSDLTDLLCGDKTVTISAFKPLVELSIRRLLCHKKKILL